ncbi:tRNA lysidine(34) synthetase TilS [Halobacillus massiliensis]|uniref:tRNA lysidine(34) synthetase TilS n=1 Tax=Halobacillus massiliensis TaxID=1926286 RepID=UPI0009E2C74F|nr:tRNA lysidine(34) synthetase TilS [Halobacillus massiliensis]
MLGTVHSFIKKHDLIKKNQTIVAAVSGGPDSLALLHFLTTIKEEYNLRIIAASVDHGLRGEASIEDVSFVEKAALQWGAEFFGTSVDVPAYKKRAGIGTQEAARTLRYQFLAEVMEKTGADRLALGHHGDDQAETMLMQLARRALPEAVQGIPVKRPFAGGFLIRPFLCLSKAEIQSYCKENGLEPRIDASNEDTEYTRNAFRKHVLPFLKEINPKLYEHMQHMSERVTEDRTFINNEAKKLLENVDMSSDEGGKAVLSKTTFQKFPLALQRSAFHLILNYLYGNQIEEISYLHEEMFFHLLQEQKPNASLDFPGNLRVIRAYDVITLTFAQPEEETAFHAPLYIGKQVTLPDGSMISLEAADSREEAGRYVYTCDSNHVSLPLIVRTRRPGDRLKLRGMNGSKKVKDIFIDQKIPAKERDTWPLVTDHDGQVLWLVGLRKGEGCTRDPSGTWLRLHYKNY